MSDKTVNFLRLFQEKKYDLLISIIENKLNDEQRTAGILNLSGVARMLASNSNDSIKLAINDFRNGKVLRPVIKMMH